MDRQIVHTDRAPAALGPYSQGIKAGQMVFTSGQLPIDPKTGNVESEDVAEQTRVTMENLRAILQAAGSDIGRVIRATVYITDINDFAVMNEVYATFFSEAPPARACVEVSALAKGAKVEIDAIALAD